VRRRGLGVGVAQPSLNLAILDLKAVRDCTADLDTPRTLGRMHSETYYGGPAILLWELLPNAYLYF
jgi:hypothetical protein